jgi:hypothetical protein
MIKHIAASIDGLLGLPDENLGKMFERPDGAEVRGELEERRKGGEKFIGADSCEKFSPITGCEC